MDIAGITIHPGELWMKQVARNVTMEGCGALRDCRYLLHDRDTKYTQSFRTIIASGRVELLARWVRSVKEECLSKIILFGERSLRRTLCEYVEHQHAERNHQGKDNVLSCSLAIQTSTARELCNVARGRAGSRVITIKKGREMAGKSWMSPVRLVVELRLRNDD